MGSFSRILLPVLTVLFPPIAAEKATSFPEPARFEARPGFLGLGLRSHTQPKKLPLTAKGSTSRTETFNRSLVRFQQKTAPAQNALDANAPPSGVISLAQFQPIYEYARDVADQKHGALSVMVIKEALKGGPPAQEKPDELRNYGYTPITIRGVQYYKRKAPGDEHTAPDTALMTLVPTWRQLGVNPKDIYDVLVVAVMPDARPAEVFLSSIPPASFDGPYYKATMQGSVVPVTVDPVDPAMAKDLTRLLIRAAVDANQLGDLTKRAEKRLAQPLGELSALVLLFHIALEAKDDAKAAAYLVSLGQRLKKDRLAITRHQVAAVAKKALENPALEASAQAILVDVAEAYSAANNLAWSMAIISEVLDSLLARNDTAAARKMLDHWRDRANKTQSNDPVVRNRLGNMYLKAGLIEDGLAELAYELDFRSSSADASDPVRPDPVGDSVPLVVKTLLELPAAKRYDVLKKWTLPTAGRKSLRYCVGPIPGTVPPSAFVKLPPWPRVSTASTMLLLIEAAREAGKSDELLAVADQQVREKTQGAEVFRLLAYLSLGSGKIVEAEVKSHLENLHKRLTEKIPDSVFMARRSRGEDPHTTYTQSDIWVTQLAAKQADLRPLVEKLLPPLTEQSRIVRIAISDVKGLKDQIALAGLDLPGTLDDDLPAGWINLQPDTAWFVQDGLLGTETKNRLGQLMYGTPLGGTFEFSVDYLGLGNAASLMQEMALLGFGNESTTMEYGGLSFCPNLNSIHCGLVNTSSGPAQWALGNGSRLHQHFNRLTVRVSPKKLEVLVNGNAWYEDANPAPTSPWIFLTSDGTALGRPGVFRNFKLSGRPEVLSQVALVAGDYLEGWVSSYTNSSLPNRVWLRYENELRNKGVDRWGRKIPAERIGEREPAKPVYDWIARDGELLGRLQEGAGDRRGKLSHLSYRRPLQDGEKVSWEFFYQAGAIHVHPALGRLAFLLEPDGVQWYWIQSGDDPGLGLNDLKGMAPPDVYKKAGSKLSLKSNDWNALNLSLSGGSFKIELNGSAVHEGPLPPGVDRDFGFFHWCDRTSARVRNIVLTGNWPKAAPDGRFQSKPAPDVIARARRKVIGEEHFNEAAAEVLTAARALPVAERLPLLIEWVLPKANRPTIQLGGILEQRNGLGSDEEKNSLAGSRILLPSRFESPALELVRLAKDANQLETLKARVLAAESATADTKRAQIALLTVLAVAEGHEVEVKKNLAELKEAAAAMPPSAPGVARLPMLIAVYSALEKPGLAQDALDLAEALDRNVEKAMTDHVLFDDRDWWYRNVRFARAHASAQLNPDRAGRAFGDNTVFPFWTAASGIDSASRTAVASVPHWRVKNGTLFHEPGFNDSDYFLLNTPLRGDFAVSAKLGLQGGKEATLRYGGVELRLDGDRKSFRLVRHVAEEGTKIVISPPLKDSKAEVYDFKLQVAGRLMKYFIDGQLVHQEGIGPQCDPWLAIRSTATNTGVVEGLFLSGSPTVPETLDLTRGDNSLWRAYYSPQSRPLQKRGEEWHSPGGRGNRDVLDQYGNRYDGDGDDRFPESAHYYQRPMVEDGVVEYDFYYSPGKAVAHPMLDRLVFLLEPEGVKLHTLTDGPYEKSGISTTNAVAEPSNRRGPAKLPLKEKSWNRVKLTVVGDTVKVALNGTDIYERAIEPTNQRFFGLFHYKDKTEARVRSMTYTGNWPKKVPAMESLFEVRK